MTEEQREHMKLLASQFSFLMAQKYEAGAAEHGGNLWEYPEADLLNAAIDEAIDQVVYLLTLKQKLGY